MDARLMLAEENTRLATTLQHYRNWASQILARYQMVNPDAAKPPRRIYIGGLPPATTEVCCSSLALLTCLDLSLLLQFVLLACSVALMRLLLLPSC